MTLKLTFWPLEIYIRSQESDKRHNNMNYIRLHVLYVLSCTFFCTFLLQCRAVNTGSSVLTSLKNIINAGYHDVDLHTSLVSAVELLWSFFTRGADVKGRMKWKMSFNAFSITSTVILWIYLTVLTKKNQQHTLLYVFLYQSQKPKSYRVFFL